MGKVIVIGAGPAGLTAAYELLKRSDDMTVDVYEESNDIGGISKTVLYNGNRMDMGGHRFFSKIKKVNDWWDEILPMQGAPAKDDLILNRSVEIKKGGPDPEKEDRVFLKRRRVSRIFFMNKFFDYPISLKPETIKNMGFVTTIKVGFSYLAACVRKRPEDNLENFYINRFGKKLYSMFFEYYTENLWGRHPREIDASWGAQRAKGLSITAILKDIFGKLFHKKSRKVETSLIEEFSYPKLGPGQLWEMTAVEIEKMGGHIHKNCRVTKIFKNSENHLTGIAFENNGKEEKADADIIISSMPIKDLVGGMNDVPEAPAYIAQNLPYRDYMTVGVLVKSIKLKNETKLTTVGNIVPDCWIYVQERKVKMGRFQIYNNWSPYLVKDLENTIWLGLEYFVTEGDKYWNSSDAKFTKFAVKEMIKLGLIDSPDEVLDSHVERIKKAYPAYFDTYDRMEELRAYLKSIDNLYCVGRNGQHRYNNMDHSMCTSFETVDNIISGRKDKDNIWNVNTEQEYHESSSDTAEVD